MKAILGCLLFSMMSAPAFAAKFYNEYDYRNFTKGGAVKVTVERSSKMDLNRYGQSCGYAALASVVAKSFELAEQKGVDYPEIIEISFVRVVSPTPWIYQLHLTSGKNIFATTLNSQGSICNASESTVSTKVSNLCSLRRVN